MAEIEELEIVGDDELPEVGDVKVRLSDKQVNKILDGSTRCYLRSCRQHLGNIRGTRAERDVFGVMLLDQPYKTFFCNPLCYSCYNRGLNSSSAHYRKWYTDRNLIVPNKFKGQLEPANSEKREMEIFRDQSIQA